jgi:predicted dehydrogenase
MVEKPMARTWTEADRAARVAAAHPGVFLQLNDDNAFDPKYRVLNALIRQGAIGEPQNMLLIRGGRDARNVLRMEVSPLSSGGGSLMAYGSHGIAGAWAALGTPLKPTVVEAVKIGAFHPERVLQGEPFTMEVDDVAQLKIRFEDAEKGSWMTVFLEATLSGGTIGMDPVKSGAQNAGYLRIIGDEGVITTRSATEIRVERWDGGETIVPLIEYGGETVSFEDEFGTMFRCVRTGVRPEIGVDFGADVIAICGAAYLSAIRNKAVTLDEFKQYSRGFVDKYGDNEEADDAIVLELLRPYRRDD